MTFIVINVKRIIRLLDKIKAKRGLNMHKEKADKEKRDLRGK
jgi:hypothetical protein